MKIKTEGLIQPIGIDEPKPRFSYVIEPKKGAVLQETYRIIVREKEETAWDSGEVQSNQSVNIEYCGSKLKPFTSYRVKIVCRDDLGNDYVGLSSFETGKLDFPMKGEYIGAPFRTAIDIYGDATEDWRKPIVFQKKFHIKRIAKKARLYVSSMGIFFCRVNGELVGDCYFAPGWTPHLKHMQYYTYDITGWLKAGDNIISITVSNGWYNRRLPWASRQQQEKFCNNLAAVAHIRTEDDDSVVTDIFTDQSWECGFGNITLGGIFDGERYNATIVPTIDQPVKRMDYDKSVLTGICSEPVRVVERLPVKEIFTTPKGEIVLDAGENMAGLPLLKIEGRAGERVELQFAEVLDSEGNFYMENYRSAKCEYVYTLKDGYQEYCPLTTYYGFRYVKVIKFPGQPSKNNFEFLVLCSDMEETGSFSCNHADINRLHKNICRSMKSNYIDIPTDCPQRDERLAWTGDAQEFLSTACFLYNVNPFFKKWLKDMALEQGPKGAIPLIVPNINLDNLDIVVDGRDSISHDLSLLHVDTVNWANFWGDASTICPYTIYAYFADRRLLEEQFQCMDKWCDFLYAQYVSPQGVSVQTQFGDWVALDAKEGSYIGATPLEYIASSCTIYSLDLTLRAAKILGNTAEAEIYALRYQHALKVFTEKFCTSDGIIKESTQTAKIIALKYNLVKNKALQARRLAEQIEADGCRLIVGIIGIPYILEVLSDNGYTNLAYKLLLRTDYPSWLYQVKKGATSIWEHLDGKKEDGCFWSSDMNSFNHYAYGSVGDWIYSRIGGIRLDEAHPGFEHFVIQPVPNAVVTQADTSFQSIHGKVACKWECKSGGFFMNVTVPFNTTATIVMPCGKSEEVSCGNYSFSEPIGYEL